MPFTAERRLAATVCEAARKYRNHKNRTLITIRLKSAHNIENAMEFAVRAIFRAEDDSEQWLRRCSGDCPESKRCALEFDNLKYVFLSNRR